MRSVFISQPMNGRDAGEIEGERAAVMGWLADEIGPCRELPSYFGKVGVTQMRPLECLGKAIELMSHADVAAFCPGWEDARGCRIEHLCAVEYGVRVIEL